MPTYQYACTECGHAFDQVQSFSDDTLTVCPECTGQAAQGLQRGRRGLQGLGLLPHRQPRQGLLVAAPRRRRPRPRARPRPTPSPRPRPRARPRAATRAPPRRPRRAPPAPPPEACGGRARASGIRPTVGRVPSSTSPFSGPRDRVAMARRAGPARDPPPPPAAGRAADGRRRAWPGLRATATPPEPTVPGAGGGPRPRRPGPRSRRRPGDGRVPAGQRARRAGRGPGRAGSSPRRYAAASR